jgi:glycosyltransferase involved in cell wall biosynthesis
MRPVNKRVIFYDKGTGGHRLPIQMVIREHLKPSGYTFDIVVGSKQDNSVTFLRELAQQEGFNHCHMLTLHDCLEDFASAREDVEWLKEANVSFSGTYYLFTDLSPHMILGRPSLLWMAYDLLRYRLPFNPTTSQQFNSVAKAIESGLLKIVTVPDERVSNRLRYPFWRSKLRLLPDPAIFSNEPSECERARNDLHWNGPVPTILIFGRMTPWKGLNILMEACSEAYSHLHSSRFRLVLAGQQTEKRPDVRLSPCVELVEFDHYIENNLAKKLFAAADCVVIPYNKFFAWSSGTFSLACASGKFVIVSDSGVMAWRVRKCNNGLVYRADEAASLAEAISRFVKVYHNLSYPIKGSLKYAATCTPDRYVRVVDEIITYSMGT